MDRDLEIVQLRADLAAAQAAAEGLALTVAHERTRAEHAEREVAAAQAALAQAKQEHREHAALLLARIDAEGTQP
jgi:hypothetical protein